jgi:hypothetical protein
VSPRKLSTRLNTIWPVRDILDVQAQAADQRADLIYLTDQHPVRMNLPGQIPLAAVACVERLGRADLLDRGSDRRWIDDGVDSVRRQHLREIPRQRRQSLLVLLGVRRRLAGCVVQVERKHQQRRFVRRASRGHRQRHEHGGADNNPTD